MKKALIFDLDGTLWDSSVQVAEAWNEVLSEYSPSSPLLTRDDVLAQIICEFTFFGFSQKEIEEQRTDLERTLTEAEEEIENGRTLSAEEVFSRFGLPKDEPDEKADELKSKAYEAMHEYSKYFRIREAMKVRSLIE